MNSAIKISWAEFVKEFPKNTLKGYRWTAHTKGYHNINGIDVQLEVGDIIIYKGKKLYIINKI